jgi:23S rRNA pseudouridine2605 synthase
MRHDPPYDPMAANAPAKGNKPAKKTKAVGTPAAGERLNKYLANSGLGSRRACEAFILAGRVDIDGEVVIDLGRRVDPERNIVRVDGERLRKVEQTLVLVLNKPVGYLSAASDPENRPLVYHLIPPKMSLRNIGRLDFNTEGVLLFTNDGDLAERLGHARFAIQRVYEARVRGVPTEDVLASLRRGVRLEDGLARAETVEIVKSTDNNAWLRLTLIEGRNREVRRLLERVGHPVVRLRRVMFAGISTAGMALGQWRFLGEAEIEQLQTRGHVGKFDLPPDPRRKMERPGLSTGPAPGERHNRVRRGEGRGLASEETAEPMGRPEPANRPAPRTGFEDNGAPARPPRAPGRYQGEGGRPPNTAPRPSSRSRSRDGGPPPAKPTRGAPRPGGTGVPTTGRADGKPSRPSRPTGGGKGGGASSRKPR